jgi:hypothetical protein
MEAYWSPNSYIQLAYALSEVTSWALIQENDPCIKSVYTSHYWALYEELQDTDDSDDSDDSSWQQVVCSGLLALYLI